MTSVKISLGLGCLAMGRKWGEHSHDIPSNEEAQLLLQTAVDKGISFFDTAPAYGQSEERLGNFLSSLKNEVRSGLRVATKCGEYWIKENQSTYVDHSFHALKESIMQSLGLLGEIDLLQIHKATTASLQRDDIFRAIEFAKNEGIQHFGASVSDIETAKMVLHIPEMEFIQFPLNAENKSFEESLKSGIFRENELLINRPFGMGRLSGFNEANAHIKRVESFRFILLHKFQGIILTGTSNTSHLLENIKAFQEALTSVDGSG
ncbi:MAG: hypothetical protein JWM56_600 [Candidatus Peribacteria bacterium]|nr:hypothetical protein [Candidatus Peribacteria bacterium]